MCIQVYTCTCTYALYKVKYIRLRYAIIMKTEIYFLSIPQDCEENPELCINLKCNVSELDSSIRLEILGHLDERFYNVCIHIYMFIYLAIHISSIYYLHVFIYLCMSICLSVSLLFLIG